MTYMYSYMIETIRFQQRLVNIQLHTLISLPNFLIHTILTAIELNSKELEEVAPATTMIVKFIFII